MLAARDVPAGRPTGHRRPRSATVATRVERTHRPGAPFPEGFLWGTATAAHQIEGGNVNNDWWAFEHHPASGCAESSGDACDSFHRWREDVDLVADLGLGAYRFSLEWSRIEPAEGEWSVAASTTTGAICAACVDRGIQPVVTFHHFTTPRWLAERGGLGVTGRPRALRPLRRAGPPRTSATSSARACTINEPNVVGRDGLPVRHVPARGEVRPRPPPAPSTTPWSGPTASPSTRCGRVRGASPSGSPCRWPRLVAVPEGRRRPRDGAEQMLEDTFLAATGGDDFIGVQCYTRIRFGPGGLVPPDGPACRSPRWATSTGRQPSSTPCAGPAP